MDLRDFRDGKNNDSIVAVNVVVPGTPSEDAITVGAVEGVMTAGSFGPMTVPSRIDQTGLIWRIVIYDVGITINVKVYIYLFGII